MAAVSASLASRALPSRCNLKQRSSARSAEANSLLHVSPINRLRLSHTISRSQSHSRRTSRTVRASGESSDKPASDSPAAAAPSSVDKPSPQVTSSSSSAESASGVPVLTIVAGVFVFAVVLFALFSLASAIIGLFMR
ncbi:hypothetical protein CLOM_g10351 [Closterium sp. NIES-68]|nr:hypothetical protein CLOM_g21464 [Closterium sp. NIES-68]GJP51189.1 hypothetical protein CLOM_g10351 [Closterium sp. NIES-68]GJP75797.1 hypothetical protein CLOP_g6197 [Closterium sp. NIES-67]